METMIRRIALPLFAFCFLVLPVDGLLAQNRLPEVLCPRMYDLQEGDAAQYEKLTTTHWYPFFSDNAPGYQVLLMKSDRGKWNGKYLNMTAFSTREKRDEWYPAEEGPAPRAEALTLLWNQAVDTTLFVPFKIGDSDYPGDYVLIGKVDPMPDYELLGLHYFKVKPGQEAAFDKFVAETWNPTVMKQPVPRLFYKADRGQRKGQYLLVVPFTTVELRNKLWPVPGEDSEASVAAFKPFQDLSNQANAFMVVENPAQDEYSDFVLIR